MIHELRIYEAAPGRLGDLNRRFSDVTLGVWERIGIRPVAFWTCLVGPSNSALTYLLAWTSMAERERLWSTFLADPEWQARKAETEINGVLVARVENQLLEPTAYSPLGRGQ
jgi:hypothetical protein